MALDLTRRRLIGGIGLLLCAPTIVRASSIMPVRALKPTLNPLGGGVVWTEITFCPDGMPIYMEGFRHVIGQPGYFEISRVAGTSDWRISYGA